MEVLRQYFGFSSFREGQQTLIDAVLAGRDVLGVMPTGGGKSLCYELPALLLPGLTLVISPLISLMKDQVMALQNAGIPAGCIHSAMSVEELREAYRDTRFGAYKILYIAPERLLTDGFCALAQELEISLLAVDEAHCISQWGQDFRPSYLKILDFLQKLPRRPALAAFTATATAQVRSDIVRILQLQDPVTVVTGFDRPNLRFEVLRPQDKRRALLELLEERRDKSGIVYCATRKGVEQICELLQSSGFAASRYHAGLSPDERRQNQEDFICDRCTVMVATNAFGMGIDKSNVSYVIHCNMPKSVEAYYQEAGRAGRDGAPADCILLFSPGDITTAKYLILNQTENDELTDEERQAVQAQDLIRLEQMTGYCKTTGCLRGYLLDYFGQPHAPRCENCGNCQAEYDLQDLTREAQMILSCACAPGWATAWARRFWARCCAAAARPVCASSGWRICRPTGSCAICPPGASASFSSCWRRAAICRPTRSTAASTPRRRRPRSFSTASGSRSPSSASPCRTSRPGAGPKPRPNGQKRQRTTCSPRSRRCGCAFLRSSTSRPTSSAPTRRCSTWRPDARAPSRSCWRSPASARPRPSASATRF